MKKICDTVYWEYTDGTIGSGKIVQITERPDCIRYEVENDELDTRILEDHNCLPENDPRVQEYIRKQNEDLWIARDKNNVLHVFSRKPICIHDYYWVLENQQLPDSFAFPILIGYPEVTFENSPKRLRV